MIELLSPVELIDAKASGSPRCELHKKHAPLPLTVERHHVIPVAWQQVWQPKEAPYPGPDIAGRGELWDCRLLVCCPTGHRSIHYCLVTLMKALTGEDFHQALTAAKLADKAGQQVRWAINGMVRYQAVGGKLQDLIAAGKWGES